MALEKRKEKAVSSRRVKPLCTLLGVFVLAGFGLHTLFVSPYFQVKTIRWEGLKRIDPRGLNEQFQPIVLGMSLIYLDLSRFHADLLDNRWIKAATIRKVLPDRIDVLITERVPVAVEIDPRSHKRILRDRDGVFWEDRDDSPALPRIMHYHPTAYQRALALMPLLSDRPDVLIDLARADDLRVYLKHERGMLRFGDRDYEERWKRFVQVEADLTRRLRAPWEADLRFPSKVIVRAGTIQGHKGDIDGAWSGGNRHS